MKIAMKSVVQIMFNCFIFIYCHYIYFVKVLQDPSQNGMSTSWSDSQPLSLMRAFMGINLQALSFSTPFKNI